MEFWVSVAIALLLFAVQATIVPAMIWLERRGAAFIQDRLGPNRVGPFGIFQPVADALKLLIKQDAVPDRVHKPYFFAAPVIVVTLAVMAVAAIPFGGGFVLGDQSFVVQVAHIPLGLLYVLAVGSFSVYGLMLGGWASQNKYALFGAMRASAQMISYEIGLGIGMATMVLVFGTFDIREMVVAQGTSVGAWGIVQAPLVFFLLLVTIFAETNRLPFDLAEGEAEIVGYHVEYSSMKFALFFMAEYMHMFVGSALLVCLFWGGWHIPGVSDVAIRGFLGNFLAFSENAASVLTAMVQLAVMLIKIFAVLWFFVWVRWTFPRFRYDQLMRFGWTGVIPYALFSLCATALWIAYGRGA